MFGIYVSLFAAFGISGLSARRRSFAMAGICQEIADGDGTAGLGDGDCVA